MFGKGKKHPADSPFLPHFRARIDILRKEDGGPWRGYMDFGPDGMTSLTCDFPGFEGRQAVIVRHRPDARIAGGETFEAEFMDAESGLLTNALQPGLRFEVWSGRVLAHGEVTEIFAKNWILPPEKAAFVFCPQCKGHWQHPRCVTPDVLRDAGEEARRRESRIAAIRNLARHGTPMGEGKAIAHHLARNGSHCHHCGTRLPARDDAVCPDCHAFNYLW
jgi:Zn finger protein HypA/HybF involved in hydrogenase expression